MDFIIIIIIINIFLDPSTQFPGNEKITLCNTKIIIILILKYSR